MKLNESNENIIRTEVRIENQTYGSNVIDIDDELIKIYKWSIRYKNLTPFSTCFGIDATAKPKRMVDWDFYSRRINQSLYTGSRYEEDKNPFYAVSTNGCLSKLTEKNPIKLIDEYFDNEGIVHLSVDVLQRKFTMKINDGEEESVIGDDIDLEGYQFRLEICMKIFRAINEIKLLNFECDFV